MAARMSAAALSPLIWCLSLCTFLSLSMSFCLCGGKYMYSRQELIDIGLRCSMDIMSNFQRSHNILDYITRSPWVCFPSRWRRRRREWKQKRGCRAGFRARLKKNPHKPLLPSIYMTNARSVTHKMDELELLTASDHFFRTCCIMIITESWLQLLTPDTAVQLAGRICYRQDSDKESGKSRSGGLCVYLHNDWCCNSRITARHCCPELEALSVMCRPFYLPQELSVVTFTAVYIPPDANVSIALNHLLTIINKLQQDHSEGAHIIAGDFNQACLKSVLPHFYQHVNCATRGSNTLDRVYSNIKHAYKAVALSHLGLSDHMSLSLTPAYTPLIRTTKPCTESLKRGPKVLSLNFRIALQTLAGTCSIKRTWRSLQRLCFFILSAASTMLQLTNASGYFQTKNPGWQARYGVSSRNVTSPLGQGMRHGTALLERTSEEASKRQRMTTEGRSRSTWSKTTHGACGKQFSTLPSTNAAQTVTRMGMPHCASSWIASLPDLRQTCLSFHLPPTLTLVPTYSRCRNMTWGMCWGE